VQFGQNAATLTVYAGAIFNGDINADASAADTLALAGSQAGTLTGFGTAISGFSLIRADADATWTLNGALSGAGTLLVGGDAQVSLTGPDSLARLAFSAAGNGAVFIASPDDFTSTISHFGAGDIIDLAGIKANSLTYSDFTLTLYDVRGNVVDTLSFAGAYDQSDFALQRDGSGGTKLTYAGGGDHPIPDPRATSPNLFAMHQPLLWLGAADFPGR
jgi:hypothetical protein